jgi:YD repeat-containing protein
LRACGASAPARSSTLLLAYEDGALVRVGLRERRQRCAYDAAGRRVTTWFAGGERLEPSTTCARARVQAFVTAQGGLLTT